MAVRLRAPRRDEAPAIAAVINEHGQTTWGVDALTPEIVEHWFAIPDIDSERDMLVAEAPDGRLLGYADVSDGGEAKSRFWIDLRLLAEIGPEAAGAMLEALEARARQRAADGALVRGFYAEPDELAQRVFTARGYELVRHSLRMERSLAVEPETPVWPEGLTLQTADGDALEPVWRAVQEGFADHWEFQPQPWDEFLHWADEPDRDFALWFLAMDGKEIAGTCLCSPREWGDREAGHVSSLSVRPPWRRRGLALALLLHSFHELRALGRERVTLGVDAENTTGAVRLYERAGMHVTRRYDTVDKPL